MTAKELSQDDIALRHKANLVKNPNTVIQSDEDLHLEFRKVLFRFIKEFP